MNTRDNPQTTSDFAVDDPKNATFTGIGLPAELQELGFWASQVAVTNPLLLVLDATGCISRTKYTGTALAYLKQPTTRSCVEDWQDELPFLAELASLIEACLIAPGLDSKCPPMPVTQSVAAEMKGGDLLALPLIALIARPIQDVSIDDKNWLETLRAWCFVQFLDAIFDGSEPNRYLIAVASKLRLGIDRDADWLKIFVRLVGPTSSFSGLTRHLANRASSLLSDQGDPVSLSSHRELLTNLRNFCQGKSPSSSPTSTAEFGGLFTRHLNLPTRRRNETEHSPAPTLRPGLETQDNLDAEDLGIEIFDADSDANQTAGVDEDDTPAGQEIKAKKVLLSAAEDYQFLPFSWNRPNAHERQTLLAWLEHAWLGGNLSTIKLAALVFAAVETGNSLRTLLGIALAEESSDDWRIDVNRGCLHRVPPRRQVGWRSSRDSDAWVSPRADQIQVFFPDAAGAVLTQLHASAPDPTTLLDLLASEPSPERQFRELCQSTPGLARVTSGMLAYWLEQHAFESSSDPVLSQLVASHPSSGLPGSCAYSSYTLGAVRSAMHVITVPPAQVRGPDLLLDSELNAAGSELCPIESLIREACSDALSSVNRLAVDRLQWPRHHNALAAYCVVVLLAALGARPVTSPHESIRNFDLKTLQVYVEDKVSSGLTQSRLLPLPRFASELIELHYLPHLRRLAQLVSLIDPRLSAEISLLASGQASLKLPLFFLLAIDPGMAWVEVSEKTLSALDLFKWPLPWNLMRHRLPTQLKRMGANHELINGLTGHGEQGTSAYGYYSARVWRDDALASLPFLTDLLNQLDLKNPERPAWPITQGAAVSPASTGSAISDQDTFGLAARRARRKQTHDLAVVQATREIEQFVSGRPLDSLSPVDWETLSRSMLLKEKTRTDQTKTLPRHDGSLRYDTLRHWITRHWQESGKKPRIRKRYLPLLMEASPFNPDAIGATSRLATAHALLLTSFDSPLARAPSRRDALSLGIVLLMAESRVADMNVLDDLLKAQNFRVLQFQEAYFLEHGPSLDRYPTSPVRRFKISEMTAALLATARLGQNRLHVAARPLSPLLLRLSEALGASGADTPTLGDFVKQLASTVNQANAQQFPGFVAAYLNGQIVSVGLHHLDWVRVQLGRAVRRPPVAAPALDREIDDDADGEFDMDGAVDTADSKYVFMAQELTGTADRQRPGLRTGTSAPSNDFVPAGQSDSSESAVRPSLERQQAQQLSHLFFQALRDQLKLFEKQQSSPRRDLDHALRRVIRENPQVSRSCRLLGEWLRSMIWRKNHGSLIAISSLGRYLNALSVCFEAVASEHDLLDCDSDDVTAFYQDVMEARWTIRPHTLAAESKSTATPVKEEQGQGAATVSTTDADDATYRTRRLALHLLRDFHRLMSRVLGAEDPDWGEIDAGDDVLSISPGLILEKEYRHALSLAAPHPDAASREDLARAFILIVAMRFGLRGAEITGLMRSDWVNATPDTVVVLVQKNKHRVLKTPAARRQVPLLFTLTDIERKIVDRFLALWEGIARGDQSIPLFASSSADGTSMNGKLLRFQASQLIKQATLNPDLSLHHARHTFANRVGLMLLQGTEHIWPHADVEEVSQQSRSHARKLLLCTEDVTRRSLWALARLLGHAHPQTSVRSYSHFLPELSDQYVWKDKAPLKKNWPTPFNASIQLDDLESAEGYLSSPDTAVAPVQAPPSPQAWLRFLYLLQHRTTLERASFSCGIELDDARRLSDVIQNVDQTLARRFHINKYMGGASTLLGHIRPERWTQLIAWAGSAQAPESRPMSSWEALESALKMIGPSRQIILFRENHFKLFRQILEFWSLPASSIKIMSQIEPHARLLQWAEDSDLLIETMVSTGKGDKFQVDIVEDGDPPTPQRHRCAIVISNESLLHDSYELVLLVTLTLFLLTSVN